MNGAERVGDAVTDADLVEYVDGVAPPETARRVVRAALRNPAVRLRLAELQELDQEALRCAAESAADSEPLGVAMRRILRAVAAESAAPSAASHSASSSLLADLRSLLQGAAERGGERRPAGGGLWRVAPEAAAADTLREFWEDVCRTASRTLVTGRHVLSLPCFAPAAAASPGDLTLRRETVTTADGVRIEFQQLPSAGLSRLRVLIDASLLAPEIRELGYNVAFLTLEDAGGATPAATPSDPAEAGTPAAAAPPPPPPDRHILVVALNGDGRGFTDFQAGATGVSAGNVLPTARGVCRLTGVTLSRVESRDAAVPAAREAALGDG